MNNDDYEENYGSIVEPKYGSKRDLGIDETLTRNILQPHSYSILKSERVNMTQYETYSIDPVGCQDADDAFSIYTENNKLFFAIHIADPTEYIDIKSDLWQDIIQKTTTKYPSNRPPIHMMPQQVLELASLQGPEEGTVKNAISILSQLNPNNYEPINAIKLLFTQVCVKKQNAYSYSDASKHCENIETFQLGLKISEALKIRRAEKTKGVKLNEVNTAYPIYKSGGVYLYEDTPQERLMKQMIAEFAIFANSFVGEYLKIHLNTGIFRTCNASHWLQTVYDKITGEELLQEIITNGIRADYLASIESHDLVGMPEYCHFTSPIRRLSDCVCHYLLKYSYFKKKNYVRPFSDDELDNLASKCLAATRSEKKTQYLDIKFRLLQVMHSMVIENESINIEYYITGYSGLFLNIIICKINHFHVHMSYTLRVRNYNKEIDPKEKYTLKISQVNCFIKFDEKTLTQLDAKVLK